VIYVPASRKTFYLPVHQCSWPTASSNDYHSVMMVVVMVTPMTVAIRLCKSRSREEGDESEHQ
jgi:hypothetical protein